MIAAGQLVQALDQIQAFETDAQASLFIPTEREIVGFALPLIFTDGFIDLGSGIVRVFC